MTVEQFQEALDRLDKGLLMHGSHQEGTKEFCFHEFARAVRGRPHSDIPDDLPDLRSLNDAAWASDVERTRHMLPVLAAYWDWANWSRDKQQAIVVQVCILTVQRIISELPNLPQVVRAKCRTAQTLTDAEAAAKAAAWAAEAAAWAAWAAAKAAAEAAAWAAWARAGAKPLTIACQLWCDAAASYTERA